MRRHIHITIIIILALLFVAGCRDNTESVSVTEAPTYDETSTPIPIESPAENTEDTQPQIITQITIDGKSDDWNDRPVLLEDPADDNSTGFLDLS